MGYASSTLGSFEMVSEGPGLQWSIPTQYPFPVWVTPAAGDSRHIVCHLAPPSWLASCIALTKQTQALTEVCEIFDYLAFASEMKIVSDSLQCCLYSTGGTLQSQVCGWASKEILSFAPSKTQRWLYTQLLSSALERQPWQCAVWLAYLFVPNPVLFACT